MIIRNGFVQMVEERFMRLATNFWGKIDFDATDYKFTVKTSENYSGIEFVLKT